MKRPIGLILAAVALGLLAAFTALLSVGFTFAAFASRSAPANNPALAANPNPPPMAVVFAVMLGLALFMLAAAVWQGWTIFGLVKLKNWARYSILVIGALLALFGLLCALGMFAFAAIGSSFVPPNPQLPAHTMQVFMTAIGLFYLCIAAVGAWWLVYFNLRSVKHYFLPAYAAPYAGDRGYAFAPPPVPGRLSHVPTSIVVFGCIYLLSAVLCGISTFITLPVFFMGITLSGWGSHLLYVGMAIVAGLIGWGLLRLDNRARIAVYAFTAFCLINFAVLATPWGHARYVAYNNQLYTRMFNAGMALTAAPPPYAGYFIVPGLIFCILFYGVQVWLIERHRTAFLAPK